VALRRERIGALTVSNALPADRLDDPEAVVDHAITPLESMAHLPTLELTPAEGRRIQNGQSLSAEDVEAGGAGDTPEGTVVLSLAGRLLAVAEAADGLLLPRKVFPQAVPGRPDSEPVQS
jgi:tRNA U55 pseudouridine synthase TruB